jgi:hypothetical protein
MTDLQSIDSTESIPVAVGETVIQFSDERYWLSAVIRTFAFT